MAKVLLGFFSWDDGGRSWLAEKSLSSLVQHFEGKADTGIIVLDNGTRSVTETYLRKVNVKRIYLPKNIHDIGLHYLLQKIAMDLDYQCCVPVENDFFFYASWRVKDCIDFLVSRQDVGACRIQQFEYARREEYDKLNPRAKRKGQSLRMFNVVTGEKLLWEGPLHVGRSAFYVTNLHWVNSPIIVKTSVYHQLFTQIQSVERWPVWQGGEGLLMRCYQKLGLKMGVLDGGCCKHSDRERGMEESTYRKSPLRYVSVSVAKVMELSQRWKEFLEGENGAS